jgi:hypothetical protein
MAAALWPFAVVEAKLVHGLSKIGEYCVVNARECVVILVVE